MSVATSKLAKMEPHGANLTGARGGKPLLTPEDVAHALGKIADKGDAAIYVAVYCRWPAAIRDADRRLALLQVREIVERKQALEIAQLALHMGEDDPRRLPVLKARAREAAAAQWPQLAPRYAAVRSAVLHEASTPHKCLHCSGRGNVRNRDVVVRCEDCHGSGRRKVSDTARANACGMSFGGFTRSGWKDVYEWTLAEVEEACIRASKAMEKALGE